MLLVLVLLSLATATTTSSSKICTDKAASIFIFSLIASEGSFCSGFDAMGRNKQQEYK